METAIISEKYIDYVLENGHQPASVYSFCKSLKIKEADFYNEFGSFAHLEATIWKEMFVEAKNNIMAEKVYAEYSAREKFLGLLYSWIEVLKKNRSFILKSVSTLKMPLNMRPNAALGEFKMQFMIMANELLMEAKDNREIEQRAIPQIMQKYPDLFWHKTLFILEFWVKDGSKAFEKTDTLIEKSVNTLFDVLAKSPLDSIFDLGKFIFQNRK